ncbi:MAG: hypothetical protein JXB88_12915 [Spirochaetales bacterium]|nr:hypothetical protein [Spirochaetales bacterium]
MGDIKYQFDSLSTRDGFNKSLRHFKLVNELVEDFNEFYNLADLLNDLLMEKKIIQSQVKPILNSLLVDKYKYKYSSYNFEETITDFKNITDTIKKWKAYDIVLAYFHPELGTLPINPKNESHFTAAQSLKKNELVTIFVGEFDNTDPNKSYDDVLKTVIKLFKGKIAKVPPSFLKGKFTEKKKEVEFEPPPLTSIKKTGPSFSYTKEKAEQAETAQKKETTEKKEEDTGPPKRMRMTPMYGIVVTNELFHNGNVEAWKKIIASYEHSHPALKVFVFYDGERINDINTLFKWGKVKRGTAIMISVAGDNIQNVAKLKRYLMQGASHRFEDFLHGPPNQIMRLF